MSGVAERRKQRVHSQLEMVRVRVQLDGRSPFQIANESEQGEPEVEQSPSRTERGTKDLSLSQWDWARPLLSLGQSYALRCL